MNAMLQKLVLGARQRIEAHKRMIGDNQQLPFPFRTKIGRLLGEEVLAAIGPVKFEDANWPGSAAMVFTQEGQLFWLEESASQLLSLSQKPDEGDPVLLTILDPEGYSSRDYFLDAVAKVLEDRK
jgi:hypothetical protein